MPNWDIFVWPVFALDWIATDQEGHVRGFCLKEGFPTLFTDGYMTSIAACVGHGVTHLAGQRISMLRVHDDAIT